MVCGSNQYFVVHSRGAVVHSKGSGEITPWDITSWNQSLPVDARYFGKVFAAMEKYLKYGPYRVYLTWDMDDVPEYGPDVIILLMGDEWGRRPRYSRFVNTVIKAPRGEKPILGIRRWLPFDRVKLSLLLKFARNTVVNWQSIVKERLSESAFRATPILKRPRIIHAPCGYCMLDELPLKPISERPYHAFFAGQMSAPLKGIASLGESPKDIARRSMLDAALGLREKHTKFKFDYYHNTGDGISFKDQSEDRSYSQRMMDSKICLAPRGTVIDTWRFFEGLKYGCLVISEPLPDDYFYENAPVIQIDSWSELDRVLAPLLEDDDEIARWSSRSLAFWEHVCGEDAIGYRIAEFVNQSTLLIRRGGVTA
jgi:hypothetical protein